MDNIEELEKLVRSDLDSLEEKEATYQGSWKKRGGVGAFMNLARKWDRLENMARMHDWDVFVAATAAGERAGEDGTALAEIRDLRRYLLLTEAEITGARPSRTMSQAMERDSVLAMQDDKIEQLSELLREAQLVARGCLQGAELGALDARCDPPDKNLLVALRRVVAKMESVLVPREAHGK